MRTPGPSLGKLGAVPSGCSPKAWAPGPQRLPPSRWPVNRWRQRWLAARAIGCISSSNATSTERLKLGYVHGGLCLNARLCASSSVISCGFLLECASSRVWGLRRLTGGVLEREFGMNVAASIGTRLHVAQIFSAWEDAGACLICVAPARQEVRNGKFPVPPGRRRGHDATSL